MSCCWNKIRIGGSVLQFRVHSSIIATLAWMGLALALLFSRQTAPLGVILLSAVSAAVFFYNMIWQFGRVNVIIEAKARISRLYTTGFILLAGGYASVAACFVTANPSLAVLGGFLIVLGILCAQGANAFLLESFIYGKRWKFGQPDGSRR